MLESNFVICSVKDIKDSNLNMAAGIKDSNMNMDIQQGLYGRFDKLESLFFDKSLFEFDY